RGPRVDEIGQRGGTQRDPQEGRLDRRGAEPDERDGWSHGRRRRWWWRLRRPAGRTRRTWRRWATMKSVPGPGGNGLKPIVALSEITKTYVMGSHASSRGKESAGPVIGHALCGVP